MEKSIKKSNKPKPKFTDQDIWSSMNNQQGLDSYWLSGKPIEPSSKSVKYIGNDMWKVLNQNHILVTRNLVTDEEYQEFINITKPEGPTADDFNLAFLEYKREQSETFYDKIELIIISVFLSGLGYLFYSMFNS